MKIIVVGKGGVGKTTIAAGLALMLSDTGCNVILVDADSTPNTACSLGIPIEDALRITPLIRNYSLIEERTGAKPGEGWGILFSLTPRVDDIIDEYGISVRKNLKLIVLGNITSGNQGCMCPAIALARQLLRHMLLGRDEAVIVDSSAGAEDLGRGLAEHFDILIAVSEPLPRSIMIALKMIEMGQDLNVGSTVLVVNKVRSLSRTLRLCRRLVPQEVPVVLIGYDENVVAAEEMGKGLDSLDPSSPLMRGLGEIIRRFIPLYPSRSSCFLKARESARGV